MDSSDDIKEEGEDMPGETAKAKSPSENESEPSSDEDGDKKIAASNDPATAVHEKKWDEMYSRLEAYKREHGHCLVPNRFAEDPQLGGWVSTQRRHYRIMKDGVEPSPMTEERAQRLEAIGFQWSTKDPRHVPWKQRYDELVSFKETYGHSQVPIGWEENVQLSNWVSTQRQEFKLLQKGRSSRLTNERIELLNKVDFVWEAQRGGPRRKRKATVSVPPRPCPVEGVGPLPSSSLDSKKPRADSAQASNSTSALSQQSAVAGTTSTMLATNPPASSILLNQLQGTSSTNAHALASAPSLNLQPWNQAAGNIAPTAPIPAPFSSLLTNNQTYLQGSLQQQANPLVSSLERVISPSLYLQLALGQQSSNQQSVIQNPAAGQQQLQQHNPHQILNQAELAAALGRLQQPAQPQILNQAELAAALGQLQQPAVPQPQILNQAELAAALDQMQQPTAQPSQILNPTQLAAALGLQPTAVAPTAQLSAQNLPQPSPATILQSLLAAQQAQEEAKQNSSNENKEAEGPR